MSEETRLGIQGEEAQVPADFSPSTGPNAIPGVVVRRQYRPEPGNIIRLAGVFKKKPEDRP
jgi:hypothetical protein